MKRPKPSSRPARGLPDRQTLIDFLRDAGEAQKADIAKHFGLKGEERRALRHMLKSLEEEGALGKRGRRGFAEAGALPPVGVVEVTSRDLDGDLYVTLTKGGDDIEPVRLAPGRNEAAVGAPGMGDRFLVRFEKRGDGTIEAHVIKKLSQTASRVLGVVRKGKREVRIEPVDRKSKDSFTVFEDAHKLKDGDLDCLDVLVRHGAEPTGRPASPDEVAELIADAARLAAVQYYDDPYVDLDLALDTASRVGNAQVWVTNEYLHDGLRVHGDEILPRLIDLAAGRWTVSGR